VSATAPRSTISPDGFAIDGCESVVTIAPSIVAELRKGPFRQVFEEKGRLDLKSVPVYVIMDEYPAFKGCAAALQSA